jgi:hypothetical protein
VAIMHKPNSARNSIMNTRKTWKSPKKFISFP